MTNGKRMVAVIPTSTVEKTLEMTLRQLPAWLKEVANDCY
jgi:hypothetical protein